MQFLTIVVVAMCTHFPFFCNDFPVARSLLTAATTGIARQHSESPSQNSFTGTQDYLFIYNQVRQQGSRTQHRNMAQLHLSLSYLHRAYKHSSLLTNITATSESSECSQKVVTGYCWLQGRLQNTGHGLQLSLGFQRFYSEICNSSIPPEVRG